MNEYLRAGFDAVLIGEVETTLLELASGKPRREIAGLAYRAGTSLRLQYPRRELRTDLDTLPLPAWDLVEMDRYRRRVDFGARLLLPQRGVQPGLPVPLQLVREAGLRKFVSRSLASFGSRLNCGN